ncbi:response regulator transcription factor [Paenibacillus alginolyticus]|uniref:Response regulator transcription factor n=1 Tax=Paenibacillus alginolyticus TaxID=59839 RepID=A0ABT4G7U6_9BACL|nr:response regulator transcription factor [Paenibacillus alginolyticus]MCY9692214.1 response regulator transcription factor [Paenibacillus alginolyticus]
MLPKILLIEQDITLAELLSYSLKQKGYEVRILSRNADGIREAVNQQYDLVLFDAQAPHLAGLQVLTTLRRKGLSVPIIVMSNFIDEGMAVKALRLGAEDYFNKPFNVSVFLAKIETVLRHYKREHTVSLQLHTDEQAFCIGKFEIYPERLEIWLYGENIPLRAKEFELLRFLLSHAQKVFTLDDIIDTIWSDKKIKPGVARGYVSSLRKKLEQRGNYAEIQQRKNIGYMLILNERNV